jgi:hypothetical protein
MGTLGSAGNAGNAVSAGNAGSAMKADRMTRPEGPWELSPGFSLGGVTINATSPEGAEEIVI